MPKRRAKGEGTLTHRQDGRWVWAIKIDGRRVYRYGTTKSEAAAKGREFLREIRPVSSDWTLGEYGMRWLDQTDPALVPTSRRRRRQVFTHYLYPLLGTVQIDQVSEEGIRSVLRPLSLSRPDAAARVLRQLRSILDDAVSRRILADNPARRVTPPRVTRQVIRPLTVDQIRHALGCDLGSLRCLIVVALDSGARQGELWALTWDDVDQTSINITKSLSNDHGTPFVKDPKTRGSRRRVPLSPQTLQVLSEHRENQQKQGYFGPLVFPSPEGHYNRSTNFHKVWKKLIAKGVFPRGTRFHDLRHTCATLLLLSGTNPKIVAERLGHSSIAITLDTYSHVLPSLQQQAAQVLGGAIFG